MNRLISQALLNSTKFPLSKLKMLSNLYIVDTCIRAIEHIYEIKKIAKT